MFPSRWGGSLKATSEIQRMVSDQAIYFSSQPAPLNLHCQEFKARRLTTVIDASLTGPDSFNGGSGRGRVLLIMLGSVYAAICLL